MEITYSKPLLLTAGVVAALALGLLLLVFLQPAAETPQPQPTLSYEEKSQVMQDLAASSNASASIPIEKKEEILEKARTSSVQQSSSGPDERQMEIIRALRYSE